MVCVLTGALVASLAGAPHTAQSATDATSASGTHFPALVRKIPSNLYDIQVRHYANSIDDLQTGGGLALLETGYLLVTGEGTFRILEESAANGLLVRRSPLTVPINSAVFRRDVAGLEVNLDWFRATSIAIQPGKMGGLYAAYSYWNVAQKCFTLRVSSISLDRVWPGQAKTSTTDWKLIYESVPCLPVKPRSDRLAGHQAGGRLAFVDEHTLALTVGDYQFDGVNADAAYSPGSRRLIRKGPDHRHRNASDAGRQCGAQKPTRALLGFRWVCLGNGARTARRR